jgi:type IV pilus assembly protein PilW
MSIHRSPLQRRLARGVTLIEVLVGIAIGLIGLIVMFQMVSVWDARTRVSNSSGDAQVAGTLAMFNLERDVKLGGMGFGTAGGAEAGCIVNAYDKIASGTANFTLSPVIITDNDGIGQPDEIRVLYGSSPMFAERQEFTNATATTVATSLKYGFKPGDLAVMTDRASTCRLIEITDDSSPDPYILGFANSGGYTNFYSGASAPAVRWNDAAASMPSIPTGNLYSLGPRPRLNIWTVNTTANGVTTLGFTDQLGPTPTAFFGVSEGVVDLKAQYGYDANSDNQVSDAEWTKAVPADWARVRAVRVALLVRSRDFAKPRAASDADAPSYKLTVAPAWSGGSFVMKNVDGTADADVLGSPNNWRYYRYRVYEKVIPLRNMIWGQS